MRKWINVITNNLLLAMLWSFQTTYSKLKILDFALFLSRFNLFMEIKYNVLEKIHFITINTFELQDFQIF